MVDGQIWHLRTVKIDRPYGCKLEGCKWVFKKKLRLDCSVKKDKAWFVAKGYTQKEGECNEPDFRNKDPTPCTL
jgi:hypothetical protein